MYIYVRTQYNNGRVKHVLGRRDKLYFHRMSHSHFQTSPTVNQSSRSFYFSLPTTIIRTENSFTKLFKVLEYHIFFVHSTNHTCKLIFLLSLL